MAEQGRVHRLSDAEASEAGRRAGRRAPEGAGSSELATEVFDADAMTQAIIAEWRKRYDAEEPMSPWLRYLAVSGQDHNELSDVLGCERGELHWHELVASVKAMREALHTIAEVLGVDPGDPALVAGCVGKQAGSLAMASATVERRTEWLRGALGADAGVSYPEMIRRVGRLRSTQPDSPRRVSPPGASRAAVDLNPDDRPPRGDADER